MPIETQPKGEINLDTHEQFRLRVGLKKDQFSDIERKEKTESQNIHKEFAEDYKNRYSIESEFGRKIGHVLVTILESHDPHRYLTKRKSLQQEFEQYKIEYDKRADSLLINEKVELFKKRDDLITQINIADKLIERELSSLRKSIADYKQYMNPGEFNGFLAGFAAEYAFAKSCNTKKTDIYYSTSQDDTEKKVDWWVRPKRNNKNGEEEIYGIQVKTMSVPGMDPEIVTIRTTEELSNYIKKLTDTMLRNPRLNDFSRKPYLVQLERMRAGILTLIRSCATIKTLQHEGEKKPAKVNPAIVIIPGEIARIDKSTGLPSLDYVRCLRDNLPNILEEKRNE